MFWYECYECYECGYKPASFGDGTMHELITDHTGFVLVEDED